MDVLESLVFDISSLGLTPPSVDSSSRQEQVPETTTTSTLLTPSTTEAEMDFSMLGLGSLDELDSLPSLRNPTFLRPEYLPSEYSPLPSLPPITRPTVPQQDQQSRSRSRAEGGTEAEQEQLDQHYWSALQRQRVVVGPQEECFRLRALNRGQWTEGCPVQDQERRTPRSQGRQPRRLEPLERQPGSPSLHLAPQPPSLPSHPACDCAAALYPILQRYLHQRKPKKRRFS